MNAGNVKLFPLLLDQVVDELARAQHAVNENVAEKTDVGPPSQQVVSDKHGKDVTGIHDHRAMYLHAIHDLFGLQVSRVKREDGDIVPKLNELMSNILGISTQPTHNLRRILPNEEPNSQLGSLTGLLHINELKELSVASPAYLTAILRIQWLLRGTIINLLAL
jgi:hypothetical protein